MRNITNLREATAPAGTVLDTIPPGLNLQATARAGEWIKVVFGNRQGFVSATIVDLVRTCG